MFLRTSMNLLRRLRHGTSPSRAASGQLHTSPRVFPTVTLSTIPSSEVVEEERWAWYTPQSFYSVCIGDVVNERYQVLYKLGYGTTSIVWMCRDL